LYRAEGDETSVAQPLLSSTWPVDRYVPRGETPSASALLYSTSDHVDSRSELMARFTTTVSTAMAITYSTPHEKAFSGICGIHCAPTVAPVTRHTVEISMRAYVVTDARSYRESTRRLRSHGLLVV